MASYKYSQVLSTSDSSAFDAVFPPGATCPHSGIYRCEGCGDEIASNKGNPFPAQNHKQHAPHQGLIRWRLAVFAMTTA